MRKRRMLQLVVLLVVVLTASLEAKDRPATKSSCTATANCEFGTISCTGTSSCSAADSVCPGTRGWVNCDGVIRRCFFCTE
jgi:hypothetical protein